jgi:hypothetical protein
MNAIHNRTFASIAAIVLLSGQGRAIEPGQDAYHQAGVMGVALLESTCAQVDAHVDGETNATAFGENARQQLLELRGWVDGYMTAMDSVQVDPRKTVARRLLEAPRGGLDVRLDAVLERCRQYPGENIASATEAARRLLIDEPVTSNSRLRAGQPRPPVPPDWPVKDDPTEKK